MNGKNEEILEEVASYYSGKLAEYGDTPKGVDWNGEEGQKLRFEQLCKIIDPAIRAFTLNDLGCGYGALFDYLSAWPSLATYHGIDISADMVRAARQRNVNELKARFVHAAEPTTTCDFGTASGVFNVRSNRTDEAWYEYLIDTLDKLDRTSKHGFSFNCLTVYSDQEKRRDYLYYADPCRLFDICKRRYSRNVALLHDYGLYEFTILVRKSP